MKANILRYTGFSVLLIATIPNIILQVMHWIETNSLESWSEYYFIFWGIGVFGFFLFMLGNRLNQKPITNNIIR